MCQIKWSERIFFNFAKDWTLVALTVCMDKFLLIDGRCCSSLKKILGQSVVTHFTRVADIYIFHNYFIWFRFFFCCFFFHFISIKKQHGHKRKIFLFFLCRHLIFTLRIVSKCYGPLSRANLKHFSRYKKISVRGS